MSAPHPLDRAADILDGIVVVPVDQRVIAAAHLTRAALEQAVRDVLDEHGINLRDAWMSSRLTVLEAVAGAETGVSARLAWTELSRACHRHSFELPPRDDHVRALIARVRALAD